MRDTIGRSGWCGDVMVVFDRETPKITRGTDGPWVLEAQANSWSLWRQEAGRGWKGFPIARLSCPGWQVWLLGEVFGLPSDAGVEEHVLDVTAGRKSAETLNGHFLLVGWNEKTLEWHVTTDRFGTVHAYHACDGRRSAIGTFSPAVAACVSRTQLDWNGLTGFFSFGFFPEDRTFLEAVRIVRPATRRVFNADGVPLREERTWSWRHQPDRRRSYEETVEQFGAVLGDVLSEHALGGRLAVPISGGLDSRTTVAILTGGKDGSAGAGKLWAYSYGYSEDSVETRIARRVAAARNLPFEALTIGPYLFKRLQKVLSCVEGFQDITQSRQAFVAPRLAEKADRVVAAHWGDVWLDDMGLVDSPSLDSEAVAEHALGKIRKRGSDWLARNICTPRLETGVNVEALLRGFISSEVARVGAVEDPDFRVKAFKTEQWSFAGRWPACECSRPVRSRVFPFMTTAWQTSSRPFRRSSWPAGDCRSTTSNVTRRISPALRGRRAMPASTRRRGPICCFCRSGR